MLNLNGNQTLADQQSAIRAYEAAGSELLGFMPLMDGTKDNGITFQDLAPGTRPAQITLTNGAVPATATLVCAARVYVAGALAMTSAYR